MNQREFTLSEVKNLEHESLISSFWSWVEAFPINSPVMVLPQHCLKSGQVSAIAMNVLCIEMKG